MTRRWRTFAPPVMCHPGNCSPENVDILPQFKVSVISVRYRDRVYGKVMATFGPRQMPGSNAINTCTFDHV